MRPHGGDDINSPFYSDLRFQSALNYYIPFALYLVIALLVFLPFSINHFKKQPLSSSRSRAWATGLRKWAMGRLVLGEGKLRWDLRGNRGMISLFSFLAIYDFLACWVHTSPPKDPEVYAMPKDRLIANRAGNLCFMQFPLIMLLVTRKNAISWLTGTSLQDLVWFHRWVGWSTFGLGAVHIGIYGSYIFQSESSWNYLWVHIQKAYYFWGIVAALAFVVIVVMSLPWVRKNYHEVFLVSHVVGSTLFFVACYFHWKDRFLGPALAMAIYFSTRLHRVFLLLHHHVIAPLEDRLRKNREASVQSIVSSLGPASALVEILDERAMKITVDLAEGVIWESGQWVQLSFVGRGLGLAEWHPFSIASIPSPPSKRLSASIFSQDSPTSIAETLPLISSGSPPSSLYTSPTPGSYHPLPHLSSGSPTTSTHISTPSTSYPPSGIDPPPETNAAPLLPPFNSNNQMIFIVTPHSSLTRRLYNKAAAAPKHSPLTTPVLIEGPYGVPPHLHGVETLVMVAGGTGIAFVSAIWRQILRKQGDVRKMVLVWSVREEHHLAWIPLPHLVSLLPSSLRLTTHFHFTGPTSIKLPEDAEYHAFLNAQKGRPEIREILQQASDEAEGRVQVIVCGPSSLSDAVVDAATATCDPARVGRGDLGGDVRVEVELFD
ncbi:ferric reductase like transmembrane component-domain-containing protein [Mrakia frigida]|uniref:ferric reductase like transmembrane component-domain-containing protein n=1 Tax=Mrakia frigida TaxID=29902 RepID=UPI003FCBF842